MGKNIIKINNLTKTYNSIPVVNQLSLDIKDGEVFGLLGPNGAGKSTTIRMIMGLTTPSMGSVYVDGYSSIKEPIKVKERLGYLPEQVNFYGNLSGFENLMFTAHLNKVPKSETSKRIHKFLDIVGLTDDAHKKTAAYSRGMKQRLGLADVLIKHPKVIILDEPTLGLDPKGMIEFLKLISNLSKKEGITVLFSSHHLHQVQHICDRVGIFVKGKLVSFGDIHDLSSKLFENNHLTIKLGVKSSSTGKYKDHDINNQLSKQIQEIDGVISLKFENKLFLIECKDDVSSEIANLVLKSTHKLVSLNKKEYGLDDIYNKYFEGGKRDEK